ncbi:MAG TPA: cell envelope integrity protein CreD [Acidobacteriaceae bacterium]
MSDLSTVQADLLSKMKFRSMGLKLIVVCGLALLMLIPALFVWLLVEDRTHRAVDVIAEITDHVGGQQMFLGPTLAIPWVIPPTSRTDVTTHGIYLVSPAQASGTVNVATEERHRSLFKVPVFRADAKLDASFDLTGVPANAPPGAQLNWSGAEIVVGVSDARGALADATLTTGGKTYTFVPAAIAQTISIGAEENSTLRLTLLGTKLEGLAPNAKFSVSSVLRFSGAQRIAVLAYGKTTQLSIHSDWPSPGFDGGFLPTTRNVSPHGFDAAWSVPFTARGVRAEGSADSITGLNATALGVSFIEVADPYQSVSRSLKYVPLFIGLIFLAYFIFEVTTGRRVHPAQYVLVGVAQIIFYLLLLSVAEHIGFDFAFLLAGVATVGLLSANAGWIFASRALGLRALATFSLLYVLIYLLLRLEDNALLVGAIASFIAVAAAMYFTRRIDWYSSMAAGETKSPAALAPER